MRNRLARSCFGLLVLAVVAGSIGCYESMYRLAPIADAKVDRALCGDWKLKSAQGGEVVMSVRNIDDHFYSVAWKGVGENEVIYMVADSTEVAGARFVHARSLPDDGTIADTHLVLRVDLNDNQIMVRNLDKEFVEQKKVDSDDSLRKAIEANIENNDLYDDDEVYTGERVQESK